MLTVETEANGDSRSTNERSPSLVGSLGSSCQYKIFLSCLGCSSRPSVKYFGPHGALFKFLCPHSPARRADSRAGSPVSLNMCLWFDKISWAQEYSDENLTFEDIAMPEVEVTVYFGKNLEEALGKLDTRIKIKRVIR